MQENWIRWKPIEELTGTYAIEMLAERQFGLTITLYSSSDVYQKIEIAFRPAESYRCTNENFKNRLPDATADQYEKDFYTRWTFFKITDSEYLSWINHESCGVYSHMNFQHFCIVNEDSIIDILAREKPQVRMILLSKD